MNLNQTLKLLVLQFIGREELEISSRPNVSYSLYLFFSPIHIISSDDGLRRGEAEKVVGNDHIRLSRCAVRFFSHFTLSFLFSIENHC